MITIQEWTDRGSGVFTSFFTCAHMEPNHSGCLVRFGGTLEDEGFDRDDICVGGISWCEQCQGATWELVSLDPLHVEPSIRTTCTNHPEHHGWIRDGKWEST